VSTTLLSTNLKYITTSSKAAPSRRANFCYLFPSITSFWTLNKMPSKRSTPLDEIQNTCFDYIIVGGGTSGCVLASRLASNLSCSVLLVEAGRDSGLAPDVLVPGKYVVQLNEDKKGLWELPTVPQRHLNGRVIEFLRGRQLGGSS
jgi:hypothetical protein